MNIESIGEVKILTQGYQAEYGRSSGLQITAVTKSGTNRFRGSVYTILDRLRLELEQLGQPEERRPASRSARPRLRLLDRRSDRQAGRQQQAVLLLRPRVPSAQLADQQRQPDPSARADRRPSATATSRRASTTTAPVHDSCRAPGHRRSTIPDNVIPPSELYAPGLAVLNRYPLPNRTQTAEHQLQLRGRAAAGREPDCSSRRSASTISSARSCA